MTDLVGQTLTGATKSVLVEHDAITISYRALYHGFKGDKRIPFSVQGGFEWHGSVAQDENAIQFDKKDADNFRELRDLIQSHREAQTSGQAPTSVADELAKLARLRDQGILSEQEFSAQKTKLLS